MADTACLSLPSEGLPPWSEAEYSYAGWVPNVVGHLSFSIVGTHRKQANQPLFNGTCDGSADRVIALREWREVKDYLISGKVLEWLKPQAAQEFILAGRTVHAVAPRVHNEKLQVCPDAQGALLGKVYVIPNESSSVIKKRRKEWLYDLDHYLERQDLDPDEVLDELSSRVKKGRVDSMGILCLSFALFRTGEVRIWFNLKDFLGREVHKQAITPKPAELELARALPAQVYYFIKESVHQHYHHEPHSDQLLPLVRLKDPENEDLHVENELSWRRETLWGLARVVSQYRRSNDLSSLKKARGVLAYAEAFQANLGKAERARNTEEGFKLTSQLTVYDFDHIRQSVDSLETAETWRKTGWSQLLALIVGMLFSSLALWSGAAQLLLRSCGAGVEQACASALGDRSLAVLSAIAENPVGITVGIVLLGWLTFCFFVRDISYLPLGGFLSRKVGAIARAIGASTARKLGDRRAWFLLSSLLAGLGAYAAYRSLMAFLQVVSG